MKYIILSKDKSKLMTFTKFASESDAKKEINKNIKHWKKFKKKYPDIEVNRLTSWQNCNISTVNFENNFVDYDIVFINQQKKTFQSTNKVVQKLKYQNTQKFVEETINKSYGGKK